MNELELVFGVANPIFFTVGMLKEALCKYPDETPVTVCNMTGQLSEDVDICSVSLEPFICDYDDEALWMQESATGSQEYMDF